MRAEYLLHRFVRGVEFPEAEAEIRKFVDDFPDLSDADALGLMAAVFDRPAFRTPFQQESSLPAFQPGWPPKIPHLWPPQTPPPELIGRG